VALDGFEAARHEAVDADVNAYLQCSCKPARTSTPSCSTRRSSPPPRPCRARRARLQGHQPPGAQAAGPGRAAADGFSLLRRRGRRALPQDRGGRAAADAGVDGAILARLEGAPDHPDLVFPEGEYLKGLAILKA
jgi:23S rRNA (cytosine1962-C5)-methyltransferase